MNSVFNLSSVKAHEALVMLLKCQVALVLLFAIGLLSACQSPAQRVFETGERAGFKRQTMKANGFDLMVMSSVGAASSEYLHVYLEGDGVPWFKPTIIASDPTSAHVLMLDLMQQDDNDSVYIGRPCYNGTASRPECDNRMWTSARYSMTVVDAMASALQQFLLKSNYQYIRLFGHSGGGALAMLLAERFMQVSDVLTIAGNLDTHAWTTHHGYTPLYSSLNPSDRPILRPGVRQWHWSGGKDKVIPTALTASFIRAQANALGSAVPSYTHVCCWRSIWRQVLRHVAARRVTEIPGEIFKSPEQATLGIDGLQWQGEP